MASSLPAPAASSKGLECYVKEEFLLPKKEKEEPVKHEDSKEKENGENGDDQSEKDTGGNKKKRGTHKKRPIFKVKNKVMLHSSNVSFYHLDIYKKKKQIMNYFLTQVYLKSLIDLYD